MSAQIPFAGARGGPRTKEAWLRFVNQQPPERPELPAGRMTAAQKAAFDAARIRYHSALRPIPTPPLRRIHRELWSQLASNVEADPPRPGAILDGDANLGKTTILTHFGRLYDHDQRAAVSEAGAAGEFDEFIPVVYVSLPANASIKELNRRLAHFYGLPGTRHLNTGELTALICEAAERCATSLFLIDDLHFLKLTRQTHRDVNDHLKDLASSIGATFVFAGIDIEGSGLLNDGLHPDKAHNSQFQGRYEHHKLRPFLLGSAAKEERWVKVLRALEKQLVLLSAPEDVLSGPLAEYLHVRSRGYMGSLIYLVRKAANIAVREGIETVDQRLLDKVKTNYFAEHGPRPVAAGGARGRAA